MEINVLNNQNGYDITKRDQKRLVECSDGTLTLYSKEFDEPYHSTKDGALNESLQKHIIPAFKYQKDISHLTILDICYGLGYNTLSTLYYIQKYNLPTKVHIISPEFDKELVESLKDFDYPDEFSNLYHIIDTISKEFYYEDDNIKIEVLIGDARDSLPRVQTKFDIIYQDAFSPKVNPLLWTKEYFATIKSLSKPNTILTTYSTASATRMGLYENGFELHYYQTPQTRRSLIASLYRIDELEWIDMELKKQRNPEAKSLKDDEF
jgi:tRNA U34 5-methylaminomethyl-2-thiouridine-forming methyltransferase MnmC